MSLPEILLDDRRFQDLVNEARLRISGSCPEWTEHNVSDPGITLIEQFAWMTEMLIYRLNRVPDKLHVALLDLLGLMLEPPSSATTELRFRLAAQPEEPVLISAEETEVGTLRTASEQSVVFRVGEDFTIPAIRSAAYVVRRGGRAKDVGVAEGTARPQGEDRFPFGSPPAPGDALYVGFEEPIARLVMRLEIDCSQARGVGVNPEDPPLRWEVATGDDRWMEAEVLEDRTGGFNYGSGSVELQLPERSAAVIFGGHTMHWVRCRVDERTRSGTTGTAYSHPPEIYAIGAAPIGALLPASHSMRVRDEGLGQSDGTPGQSFRVDHAPMLPPEPGETLEVREPGGSWQAWEARESFAGSGPKDRHYVLDAAAGEVRLGPVVRQADGGWRQFGAVPPKDSWLRIGRYRHGGGRAGNVAADTLTTLKSPIPGVGTVTNPRTARGGVDPETLEAARQRAALEIRSRYRAVTAEDFEFLCGEASPRVARAVCVPPAEGAALAVYVLPRVHPADRQLSFEKLTPDRGLLSEVADFLDERRLVGTTVLLLPVPLRGVTAVVNVEASPLADLQRVEEDVEHALYTFVNPLVGGSPKGPGDGWPFGRGLNQGELYGVVHAVEGVEAVRILRIYETDLRTGEQAPKQAGSTIPLAPNELVASGAHIVKAAYRED